MVGVYFRLVVDDLVCFFFELLDCFWFCYYSSLFSRSIACVMVTAMFIANDWLGFIWFVLVISARRFMKIRSRLFWVSVILFLGS